MPFRRRLFAVDVVEEAARYLLQLQVLLDAQTAAPVMVCRMKRALCIRTGAEFFRVFHLKTSSGVYYAQLIHFTVKKAVVQPFRAGFEQTFLRGRTVRPAPFCCGYKPR